MVKWESPIFSELRNQLGETVVFSNWKGQNYMREYVDVLGGDEPEQQAIRAKLGGATKTWQFLVEHTDEHDYHDHWDDSVTRYWDRLLDDNSISAFNYFTQHFMDAEVAVHDIPDSSNVEIEWSHSIDEYPVDLYHIYPWDEPGVVFDWRVESDVDHEGSTTFNNLQDGWNRFFLILDHENSGFYNSRLEKVFGHYSMDLEAGTAEPAYIWI